MGKLRPESGRDLLRGTELGFEAGIPDAQVMARPRIQVLNRLPWNYDTET